MNKNYTLSCLVPMYKEGEKVIKPLLDSIAIQQNVDFDKIEVVITHDGIIPEDAEYRLSEKFIKSYPFDIKYLEKEHGGVSAARNYCLDNCSGEYVSFMDCDDMFFNACGLWIIFNEIKKGQFDVYTSKFIEEIRTSDTKEPMYINRENDSTFVHGKVQRRQFLINNNIRWNDALTIHEDSYFNCLAQIIAQKNKDGFKYCDSAFYLWRWREDSVCRRDPLYLNKTYVNMFESNAALVQSCIDRRLEADATNLIISMIYESYYAFNTDRWWSEEGHEYLLPTEKRFKKYWLDFKYLFDKASKEHKISLISGIRSKYFAQGLMNERITFDDWIKHIEELDD